MQRLRPAGTIKLIPAIKCRTGNAKHVQRLAHRQKEDRERIMTESDRAGSALRIHDLFQQSPFLTANQLVQKTGLSAPTVNAALVDLERFGIINEVTGRKRGRVFSYRRYLAILSEGTDPIPTAV